MSNLDKGDLARSINGAYTILAADTDFIGASTPTEIAGAMGILAKAFLDTTAQLIEETGIQPDGSRARGLPPTQSPPSSQPSPPSSGPSAPTPAATGGGGLNMSPKQEAFFKKLPNQAVKNNGSASYTFEDIQNAATYDDRQAMVEALKAEAGYGPS